MIGVLTLLQARPERLPDLVAALEEVVVHSLEHPGCLAMHLHADPLDLCRMMIYEQWGSKTDFDVNGARPAVQSFWERRLDLLQDDIEVLFFDLLPAPEIAVPERGCA